MAANADSAADILESITISDHGADEMACGASAATSDIVDGAHVLSPVDGNTGEPFIA
jgi:hypothetical protein